MHDLWNQNGALARVIDGYEHRPQQEEFAAHVYRALEDGGVLIAEAPTGVGKSLAYLVPAALWALPRGARVVVSTNTKNLQDQLHRQDVPKLAALVGDEVRSAVVKGRSNYACARRWRLLENGQLDLGFAGGAEDALELARAWIRSTETGDLSELRLGPGTSRIANLMRVEERACNPSSCSLDEECFLRRLRRRAWSAQIVCVNHAIAMGQLLGRWDMLPPFDVLILDECHNVPRVAADQLGISFDASEARGMVPRIVALAAGLGGRRARRRGSPSVGGPLVAKAREAGESAERLFDGLRGIAAGRGEGTRIRYGPGADATEAVVELGTPVLAALESVAVALRDILDASVEPAGVLEQVGAELQSWTRACSDLRELLEPLPEHGAYWVDSPPALRWSPVDVADELGGAIEGACGTTILTSATLTVGGGFEYFKATAGLTEERSIYPRCVRLDSPFDLQRSVLFLVPGDAPDPRDERYTEWAAYAVRRLAESTMKKALVLFTAHSMLRKVRAELDGAVPGYEFYAQGVDGDRSAVTRAFKESRASALLGAASFWEGVDFPGEEAEMVVIARLPFPVPWDPIVQARSELLRARGLEPFWSYDLPEAVMRLKQGFGRLIRARGDRGIVVVLDPRIVRASYARAFLDSLPVEVSALAGVEAVASAAAEWFKGVNRDA
jgi:ATP-dependent DNA helicase DinG